MAINQTQILDSVFKEMDISGSTTIRPDHGGFLLMGSGSNGKAQYLKIGSNGELAVSSSNASNTTISGAVEQGIPGAVTAPWFFELSDGTNAIGVSTSAPLFVSGAVDVGNFPVTQSVVEPYAMTSTALVTTASLAATTIMAANPVRQLGTFYLKEDDGTTNTICYLKFGANVTSASYSVILFGHDYFEIPRGYTGVVSAIFNITTGSAELASTEIF